MSADPMARRPVAMPSTGPLARPAAPPTPKLSLPSLKLPAGVLQASPAPSPKSRPQVAQDNTRVAASYYQRYEQAEDLPLPLAAMAHQARPVEEEDHSHHTAHSGHTAADGVKVAKAIGREAAEILESLVVIVGKSNAERSMLRDVSSLLAQVPAPVRNAVMDMLKNPVFRDVLLPGLHKIAKAAESAVGEIARLFPRLAKSRVTAIVMEQSGKALGRALPLVGAGIAAWGTVKTLDVMHDSRVTSGTKALYAGASALDWGAAAGGVLAETGVGEVAAIAAAAASIVVWSKAEASREMDLETYGERRARAMWEAMKQPRPKQYFVPAPRR